MANSADMVSGRTPVTDSKDEVRILLIGKTGDGKSATGNTILGNGDSFKSTKSPSSVTKKCSFAYGERFGRKLLVVDTPGLCDTNLTNTEIRMELMRSLGLTIPGFHVIAYVLRGEGRFTRECSETKRLFFEWFGSNVNEHALIILTHWDKGDPDKYFDESPELKNFKETCGNRVVAFENKGSQSDKEVQVKTLLATIDEVIRNNGGTHFSTTPLRIASKCIRAAETPVFQWFQQKFLNSKEETEVSSDEVKESDETTTDPNFPSFSEEQETAIKTEMHEAVRSHTETVDKSNLADVSASCSKEEKNEIKDMSNIYEDANSPLSEESTDHNVQSVIAELETAIKTETYETVTSHTETADKSNLADVSASCSKEKKKEIEDLFNIYEDVNPPNSEYKAANTKPKPALETKSKKIVTPPTEAADNPILAVASAPYSKKANNNEHTAARNKFMDNSSRKVDVSSGNVKNAEKKESSLNFQPLREGPNPALKTTSNKTATPPPKKAVNPNPAVAPAPCSKKANNNENKATRNKFMDNSFLKRFMKIFDWAVEKVCGIKGRLMIKN